MLGRKQSGRGKTKIHLPSPSANHSPHPPTSSDHCTLSISGFQSADSRVNPGGLLQLSSFLPLPSLLPRAHLCFLTHSNVWADSLRLALQTDSGL